MQLLLDTHTFLWWSEASPQLPAPFRTAIAQRTNDVFVSAVTVWEIGIKRRTGKLAFSGQIPGAIERLGFKPLPIAIAHAEAVELLPLLHRDPFDRMLIAQAEVERMILLTLDTQMMRYAPKLLPTS